MKTQSEKPTPEAKALSLFLMAYKTIDPIYKEKSKRINKMWDLVMLDKLSRDKYYDEVQSMLLSYGGYDAVIEKTVKYYIEKTGAWKSQGDDKYGQDTKLIADKLLTK